MYISNIEKRVNFCVDRICSSIQREYDRLDSILFTDKQNGVFNTEYYLRVKKKKEKKASKFCQICDLNILSGHNRTKILG